MPRRGERGQATVEYVGVALLVAALLGAVMVAARPTGIADAVVAKVRCAIDGGCKAVEDETRNVVVLDPGLRRWILDDYANDPVLEGGRALARQAGDRRLARASGFGAVIVCGAAIAKVILASGVPAWRIVALATWVRRAGGIRRAAQGLLAATRTRKAAEVGAVLLGGAEAILGIDDVMEECGGGALS